MMNIHLIWTVGRLGYRLARLPVRAGRDLALLLWRQA